MLVIIDNGHGRGTAGKRSPDGRLREWQWTREVAKLLASKLEAMGLRSVLLTPEDDDVPLSTRAFRANQIYRSEPAVLVSLHCNASGMGHDWGSPSGWSAFVAPSAGLGSRRLASLLCQEAESMGLKVRKPKPGQPYWVQNLAICRDTKCPAVLTENLFMDNLADCHWLLTPEGKEQIAALHANALAKYINNQ